MSILYYSKNCPNCLDFLKKLREENMLEIFDEYFCVDQRYQLPRWLTSVPTIIVQEYDQPLIGEDAFAWLTYKLNQKYKRHELGTINQDQGNFVDLTMDPTEINLDSDSYISITNIDRPLKPNANIQMYQNAETMDVAKRLELLQQERSQLMVQQSGPAPPQPNFQQM